MTTSAWSMEGSSGCTWNSANKPVPMPTITASTSDFKKALAQATGRKQNST